MFLRGVSVALVALSSVLLGAFSIFALSKRNLSTFPRHFSKGPVPELSAEVHALQSKLCQLRSKILAIQPPITLPELSVKNAVGSITKAVNALDGLIVYVESRHQREADDLSSPTDASSSDAHPGVTDIPPV